MGYSDLLTPLVLTVTGDRVFTDLTPCVELPGALWEVTFNLPGSWVNFFGSLDFGGSCWMTIPYFDGLERQIIWDFCIYYLLK